MSPLPLSGKTALITGSSRSIGAAIAARLAAEGANVVINYVNGAKAADEVVAAINAKGAGIAKPIQADVSSVAGAKALVEKTLEAFQSIDILVLNAGVMGLNLLENIDEASYENHFNTNVKGPLFLTQAAAPHLRAGGRVIFFSTSVTAASLVTPNYLLYAATKGAIEQISRTLSKDLGKRQITVNTISPGPVDTPLFTDGKTEQQINFFVGLHPPGRIGKPEDISNVVAFLAGPDSVWVNGQNIRVNGGYVV
ncbi:hypothetical protein BOTBODRAFT_35388 [Botryobasidium botryosum FD-172 SS1]|uniref:NAD(P)-binding protein n=1 Tax=Botryobasidium botryosum (strain FD-172 SS1) TaxID=930990 RepID=A0A067MHF2_BOTB1|nr:hypothetical protein BOTBODRAFT_35388 [Botryobasidium botryosum FD-172 SS1]